jgi:hypothetical protein
MEIYVWPDCSWMPAEDYEDVRDGWRGDDFLAIEAPSSTQGDHHIDMFVEDYMASCYTSEDYFDMVYDKSVSS